MSGYVLTLGSAVAIHIFLVYIRGLFMRECSLLAKHLRDPYNVQGRREDLEVHEQNCGTKTPASEETRNL